jgi:hypothetical protein
VMPSSRLLPPLQTSSKLKSLTPSNITKWYIIES